MIQKETPFISLYRKIEDAKLREQEAAQAYRERLIHEQLVALEEGSAKAIETLIELVCGQKADGTAVPDAIRLKAADSILSHVTEHRKLYDFAFKLAKFEELVGKATITPGKVI